MAKKPGGGGQLENFDDETGKYVAADGGSSGDAGSSSPAAPKIDTAKLASKLSGKLKGINLFFTNKSGREYHKLRTEDEVVNEINDIITDDVLSELKKAGFESQDWFNNYFGGLGMYADENYILTNIIARKSFVSAQEISEEEFDKLLVAPNTYRGSYKYAPNVRDFARIRRGFHDLTRMKEMIADKQSKLVLPYGSYGSAIYSEFSRDGSTASGYGRSSYGRTGYVAEMIVDNRKGKTITQNDYYSKKQKIIRNLPTMKSNLDQRLSAEGYSDFERKKILGVLEHTVLNDETFPALLMGYDLIYDESAQYSLLLNLNSVYITDSVINTRTGAKEKWK